MKSIPMDLCLDRLCNREYDQLYTLAENNQTYTKKLAELIHEKTHAIKNLNNAMITLKYSMS